MADDDALARIAALGAETFVQDQQGYSFMVVRESIEDVAKKLKTRPGSPTTRRMSNLYE